MKTTSSCSSLVSTSTVTALWALHSSDSVKWKEWRRKRPPRSSSSSASGSDGTLHMRRPAGERTAPGGASSSWKRSAEPSGSEAANWKTKFSPAKVRRSARGGWKDGGLLTGDGGKGGRDAQTLGDAEGEQVVEEETCSPSGQEHHLRTTTTTTIIITTIKSDRRRRFDPNEAEKAPPCGPEDSRTFGSEQHNASQPASMTIVYLW